MPERLPTASNENQTWSRTQTGRTPPPHYRLGHLNRRTPHARKRPHSAQVTVTADDPRTDMACGIASRDRAARKLAEALASTTNSRLVRAPRAKARAGLGARCGANIVHTRLNLLGWHGCLSTREMIAAGWQARSTAGTSPLARRRVASGRGEELEGAHPAVRISALRVVCGTCYTVGAGREPREP